MVTREPNWDEGRTGMNACLFSERFGPRFGPLVLTRPQQYSEMGAM